MSTKDFVVERIVLNVLSGQRWIFEIAFNFVNDITYVNAHLTRVKPIHSQIGCYDVYSVITVASIETFMSINIVHCLSKKILYSPLGLAVLSHKVIVLLCLFWHFW